MGVVGEISRDNSHRYSNYVNRAWRYIKVGAANQLTGLESSYHSRAHTQTNTPHTHGQWSTIPACFSLVISELMVVVEEPI